MSPPPDRKRKQVRFFDDMIVKEGSARPQSRNESTIYISLEDEKERDKARYDFFRIQSTKRRLNAEKYTNNQQFTNNNSQLMTPPLVLISADVKRQPVIFSLDLQSSHSPLCHDYNRWSTLLGLRLRLRVLALENFTNWGFCLLVAHCIIRAASIWYVIETPSAQPRCLRS